MGDHWLWEAKELNPQEPFYETTPPSYRESVCLLKISNTENYCISHPQSQFCSLVGDLIWLGQKFYNDATQETQWWGVSVTRNPNLTRWPTSLNLQ
jgi:hypothetical protein